jgi:uncharacterized membrane protein YoaK (UPF0700 family)
MLGRNGVVVTIAGVAGCIDAASYVGLGHVFPANMTGNTVLLGLALGQVPGLSAARSLAALGGFVAGVALGTTIGPREGGEQKVSRAASRTLAIEAGILAAYALIWHFVAPGAPQGAVRYLLIALAALAMGLQSAVNRQLHTGGVATTYITGTLTKFVTGLLERRPAAERGAAEKPSALRLEAMVLLAYLLGAIAAALIEARWPSGASWLPLVAATIAAAEAWRMERSRGA